MDAKTRARAARASREVLPDQVELFHVEHPAPVPPVPRELLVEMLGAVIVKVVCG
jgi:hypothetical protein